jgi:predicted AAA+ superfamily ATPase
MFAETYLIHLMPRYGKTNEQILSPQKIYAADLGIKNVVTGFRDKGAIFENYVYLLIKGTEPRYIYQDTIELDFFTKDRTLIEVKYNQTIEGKQKLLFDGFDANSKLLISRVSDLANLPVT